jgi:hypothetical protein
LRYNAAPVLLRLRLARISAPTGSYYINKSKQKKKKKRKENLVTNVE